MKRFINTQFVYFLQNNLSEINQQIIKNLYEEFAVSVLTEKENFVDNSSYYNSLVYTKVELSYLTERFEKKERWNF